MAKPTVIETRFDFRGGRNTAISPDLLNPNELVDATNARLSAVYGAVTKRTGTQRIHQTAFGSTIRGVWQWDGPSGKQVVVISGGHLWYRNGFNYATAFTDEGTNVFGTGVYAYFMPFRDSSSGAPLCLFIASDGKLFKWTGTVLTDVTATTTAADRLIAYHTRAFARNKNYKKNLFWGKVGDATDFATGAKTAGGSALVDVYNGEEIIALEVIGSSLVIAAEDSVMRFSGHATDDIVIAQDTEGISSEVGAVGGRALTRFENVAAMLSERGPYAVTETAVEPIGEQVGPDFATMNPAFQQFAQVGYNRGRKELMFAFCADGSGQATTVMVQSVRLQAWFGPWEYSSGITYFTRYEDVDGEESILAGHNDGYVRDLDVGFVDDVLYDGSGGTNITMTVELPTLHFGNPGKTKSLNRMKLQAQLPSGSNLRVQTGFDSEAMDNGSYVDPVLDGALRDYRVDLDGQGKRCRLVFEDASAQQVAINGFTLEAVDMSRP